ncbi:hypothetical protein BDV26DRAFT_289272 [Aspergillus bertholletiae]|uniref:MARVEL domain-containing protein n=1 Tax=Aspergillus bertholletiae TaxID=1226010 RepID=A0A5N7BIM6_9EURO|nr:hypothetical protein BDV26DRAFT_289272 [Aspergillus bertholletiae]
MNLFDPRWKLPLLCFQIFLVITVIAITIPRLFMKNQPRTRANTIGLGMGAKSLVIILYQVLTEHVAALRKWGNLKAYMILNGLEIVFWAAVVVLTTQANIQKCVAPGCLLGWGVAVTAGNLSALAIYGTVVSYREWKEAKGGARPDGYKRAHELRSVSPVPSV